MGARINARMGLNTWAAFYGSDADAVVAGDVAMKEEEVTPAAVRPRRSRAVCAPLSMSHKLDARAAHVTAPPICRILSLVPRTGAVGSP